MENLEVRGLWSYRVKGTVVVVVVVDVVDVVTDVVVVVVVVDDCVVFVLVGLGVLRIAELVEVRIARGDLLPVEAGIGGSAVLCQLTVLALIEVLVAVLEVSVVCRVVVVVNVAAVDRVAGKVVGAVVRRCQRRALVVLVVVREFRLALENGGVLASRPIIGRVPGVSGLHLATGSQQAILQRVMTFV